MAKLTLQDKKRLTALRRRFPKAIEVDVRPAEEGGFWAEVTTFPGCVTQAETFAGLIEMVNDAVATVLEVSRGDLPYVPTYIPPVKLAQRLGVFPGTNAKKGRVMTFERV